MKKILFISFLAISRLFFGQISDYVLISTYDLSLSADLIIQVDIRTCEKENIFSIQDGITDIAFQNISNKIFATNLRGETYIIDTVLKTKSIVNLSTKHNGITFNKNNILYASDGNHIDILDYSSNSTEVLGYFNSDSLGISNGDITFFEDILFLITDKGYIVEIDLENISSSKLFAKTGFKKSYGISSICNYGFYLYNDNDNYKMDFNNPESIELVCENITENTITGASSIFEHPDSVQIQNKNPICPNFSSHQLEANGVYSDYIWSTGDTTQNISIKDTGTYWVNRTNYCGESTDSIHILFRDLPKIDQLDSAVNCFPLSLNLSNKNYSVEWYNGATTQEIDIQTPGDYWVTISDGFCSDTSFLLSIKRKANLSTPMSLHQTKMAETIFSR